MSNQSTTVGVNTYDKIKRDIIFGRIEAGTKLKLGKLKDQYGASVSTLREILNRLASEGFVTSEEQRGFFVSPVSRNDLLEIADLRILLETTALRASLENGTTEWEGNLVAAHHKLHTVEKRMLAGDKAELETWKRYDWEFHLAMIQACENTNLLELHSIIFDKYLRYQMLWLTYRGQEAVDEHKQMFEAALARNADEATKMLTTHIQNGVADPLERL